MILEIGFMDPAVFGHVTPSLESQLKLYPLICLSLQIYLKLITY